MSRSAVGRSVGNSQASSMEYMKNILRIEESKMLIESLHTGFYPQSFSCCVKSSSEFSISAESNTILTSPDSD